MSIKASFSEKVSEFSDKHRTEVILGASAVTVAGVIVSYATRNAIGAEDVQFGSGVLMTGGAAGLVAHNLRKLRADKFETGNNSSVFRNLTAGTAIVGMLAFGIASAGRASREGGGQEAEQSPDKEVSAPTTSVEHQGDLPAPEECEIPVDLTQANEDEKMRFEQYLISQGFYEGPADGIINSQESTAVDRLQEALQLDTGARWGLETCLVTPFGDGDPETPGE